MRNDGGHPTNANNYMQLDEPYPGETNVLHYLEVLRDRVGFDELKKKVVNPLKRQKDRRILRLPAAQTEHWLAADDPENPQIIEDFIRAIGAEPVGISVPQRVLRRLSPLKKEMSGRMSCNIVDSAAGAGAEMLITACPLCMYNLNKSGGGKIPGVLLHRASRRGPWRERGGVKVSISKQAEQIRGSAASTPYKCMKCGKCSASCPSFNEMDIKPHQFVSHVLNDDIESPCNSKSLWKCLSCFACIERCPRR